MRSRSSKKTINTRRKTDGDEIKQYARTNRNKTQKNMNSDRKRPRKQKMADLMKWNKIYIGSFFEREFLHF